MTVTYRDLTKSADPVDPISFLFRKEKPFIPESVMTPALIVRYYQALMARVSVKDLAAKSDDVPHGLESLVAMLQYEPKKPSYSWAIRTADQSTILAALPKGVPYQMQYLQLLGFGWPRWENAPRESVGEKWADVHALAPISRDALLVSRKQKLYFATATWAPREKCFPSKIPPKDPFVFHLAAFSIEAVEWDDPRILARIEGGAWKDFFAVNSSVKMVVSQTVAQLKQRLRWLHSIEDDLEYAQNGVYHGR